MANDERGATFGQLSIELAQKIAEKKKGVGIGGLAFTGRVILTGKNENDLRPDLDKMGEIERFAYVASVAPELNRLGSFLLGNPLSVAWMRLSAGWTDEQAAYFIKWGEVNNDVRAGRIQATIFDKNGLVSVK